MKKINKKKLLEVIEATENWLARAKNKEKYTETGGLTIYGCECRNLEEYKDMLNYTYIKELDSRLSDLHRAI